jgi:hypothetical protein
MVVKRPGMSRCNDGARTDTPPTSFCSHIPFVAEIEERVHRARAKPDSVSLSEFPFTQRLVAVFD